MIKLRNMRWAGHVVQRDRQVMHTKLWLKTMEGRNLMPDVGADGKVLK
jgi:hypothetical protein